MTRFGPSGNSNSFYAEGNKRSEQVFSWLAKKGLNAYEYSFGRGIQISDEKALIMANESLKNNVQISVHAPYYINFANPSPEMIQKSIAYLINSAKKLRLLGGNRVIFHPASVGKLNRDDAISLCHKNFDLLLSAIYENDMQDLYFCPETMGKINQIGDEMEIAQLCAKDKCLLPTIDFGHLNARTYGALKTESDFERVIESVANVVGESKTKVMHVHFSQIEYSKGGEVKHLTFADEVFGPSHKAFLNVVNKLKITPVVICESDGTQTEDAKTMMDYYNSITIR